MKITELFSKLGRSMFRNYPVKWEKKAELGTYSYPFPVKDLYIREFGPGLVYPQHTAPQSQLIIYLGGKVRVTASNGDSKIFGAGDILHANDLEGEGHISETLEAGTAVIVTLDVDRDNHHNNHKPSKPV